MRKIKEVLRLRFELQLGQREIARAWSISQGAVHNYLKKAAAVGIGWPLPEGWDEKRIERTLFGDRQPIERRQRAVPNFPALHDRWLAVCIRANPLIRRRGERGNSGPPQKSK